VSGSVVNEAQTLNAYWHSEWVQETGMFSSGIPGQTDAITQKRHIVMSRTKTRLAGELQRFMQQYSRKAQASEPNDRQYDRKLEKKIKRLPPLNYQIFFIKTSNR
jgi:hypothetical protein